MKELDPVQKTNHSSCSYIIPCCHFPWSFFIHYSHHLYTRNVFEKEIERDQVQWLKSVIVDAQKMKIRRLWFEASLGKKFSRPHLNQCLGAVVHACHSRYMRKHKSEDCS
jgi:hypothetical protein